MINFIQHHKPKKKKVFLKIILPTILVLGVITASVFFWSFNHRIVKGTFELQPKISDAAGIESDTTFLLKSSNTLTSATIQKYLSVEPFIAMDVKQVSPDGKQFELIPGKPLEEEKVYSIAIDGPIAEKAQSWAYQVKAPFQIILAIPGDRHTGIPLNTGIEVKFNREIGQESSQFFEITPEVRGTFEYQNKKIIFIPQSPLSPKTIYTVHLKKGLVAKDSSDTLLEENTFSFETEDPTVQGKDEPRFEFGYDTFLEFTPESESLFEVFTHKIRSVPISLYQFANSDEFIATYRLATEDQFSWTRFHTKFSLPTAKKTLSVTIPIEKQDSLEYIRLPKKLPEGFYAIETQRKGATSLITWFQVSPLIGFSAVSATKSLIWVKDSTTKAAVSGVRITLENTTIASTDNDGIALLDTPNLLVADGGEDKNPSRPFFHLTKDGHSLVVETSSNSARPSDRWWTAVSVDRPVYLPTDRIHYWGVLKRRDGTDMKGNEITVQLRDAYSTSENEPVYTETKTTISAFSTLTGDLSYASVRPGYYELVMKSGDEVVMTQGITIRTYVKPAYFFTLEPDRRAAFVGDTVTFKVKASFYDGTPLANIKAAYSFAYGEETREVVLNESGEGSFSTRVSDSDDRFLSAMVTPAVSEEGEISAITEVLVFPSRTHLVVDPTYKDGLTEFAITTRAVDLSDATKEDAGTFEDDYLGAPQAQARVDIVVTKVTWKETLRERRYDPITKTTYPIYSYDSVRTIAQKTSVNTDAQGRAPFSWKGDDKNASYEVKFTVKDEEGRSVSVGRTAYGLISYYRESFSLGVILENTESEKYNYALNEPISLVVEREDGVALPSGSKRFLFLRAVNGHISYQLSDSSEYKDTFKEAYIPNVQIFAIWFQGSRFYDTNRWGGGIQNISLDEAEKKLSIAIKSDKDRYRPSDEVKVSLDVTGPDSKPRRAEVNIAAIDEALRVFGGSEDILGQLYRDVFTPIEFFSTHRHPLESLAEGGGCFLSGTRVLTPNGERAIEDLRVGDTVLSRASSTSKELLSTTITQSTSHIAFEYIVLNEKLRLTPNHRLWVNGSWKKAGAVAIGDILITRDGKEELVRTVERKREQRRVYNIEINPTHTFFADGYYVHNQEKGGGAGGPRKDFKDTAFFKTVSTDSNGHAEVSFRAPDNLTSWYITAHGVTSDLFAGSSYESIPVGLPFFVDATLNTTYLTGDDVLLRLRVFGTETIPEKIQYTVESATLPFKKIQREGGKMFEFPLQNLPKGVHALTITASAGGKRDSLVKTITVSDTHFTKATSRYYELQKGAAQTIDVKPDSTTLVTLCSCDRQRLYGMLQQATYGGVRADDRIASVMSDTLLKMYFKKEFEENDVDLSEYQSTNGGFKLLPYAGEDIELSALVAHALHVEKKLLADPGTLKEYLWSTLSDEKADVHRSAVAVFGLSAFREPVLTKIDTLKKDSTLTNLDRVYLALALNALGAREDARKYYKDEIQPHLTEQEPYLFFKGEKDEDDDIRATALLAILAAQLQERDVLPLERYSMNTETRNTRLTLERVLYAYAALPKLSDEAGAVSIITTKGERSHSFKAGESLTIALSPQEVSRFSARTKKGHVSMVVEYDEKTDPAQVQKDPLLGIERWYEVDGKRTTSFKEGDLVKVLMKPSFASMARESLYEVTDFLPSGLRLITEMGTPISEYDQKEIRLLHPLMVDGQRAVFIVWKEKDPLFYYYARVVTKGSYRAEQALIQSTETRSATNISQPSSVTIQ